MKMKDIRNQFEEITPDVPQVFHSAMCSTLNEIVQSEQGQQVQQTKAPRLWCKRRGLIFAVLAALLLATAAYAAVHWHIFDSLAFMVGENPTNADMVMQGNLAHESINGVDIDVLEAGYDGRTLFIRYRYTMTDVTEPLGWFENGQLMEGIGEEQLQLLDDHHVGWWIDHLWMDGKSIDMPGNSGGITSGSANPGEIIQTEYWRLDNVGVYLTGKVEIALPIGERQSVTDFYEQAERYEDGSLHKPDKGVVCFTLDTSGMLDKVVTVQPNLPVKGDNVTAQVSEACFTPLMTYITLKLAVDPDAMDAFIRENGEGYKDESGNLLWPYGGMDVFDRWVTSLTLVDENGVQLFPETYGNNGYGNEWAEFIYPCIDLLPDALYLAPLSEDGITVNMAQAVRVK